MSCTVSQWQNKHLPKPLQGRPNSNCAVTWENDTLHSRIRLQELGSSHGIFEMLLHPQVQRLQPAVAQVAVEWRWYATQCWEEEGVGGVF